GGGQRRREDGKRPVERVDDRDDAGRELGDRGGERRPRDVLLLIELGGVLGGLVEPAGDHHQVDRRLEPYLAVLAGQDLGALVGVFVESLEGLQADGGSFGGGQRGPGRPGLV